MNRQLLIALVFIVTTLSASAQLQPFLLLEKPGTKHRIRYFIGDEVEFKLYDDKEFIKGTIVELTDTSFFINDYLEIAVKDVEALADREKGKGIKTVAVNAFYVIPVFFLFSAANNTFNTGETPIIDEEVYPLAAVFAGIGAFGLLYNGRRYRLENKWRLLVIRH